MPPDQEVEAATYMGTNGACRSIFGAVEAQYQAMLSGTKNDQPTAEAARADHYTINVNNIDGNSYRNTEETQRFLASKRQQKWISIKISSVFSNPTQAVHTLMNWFQAEVTENDVKAIPYISSLNQTTELAQAIQAFTKTQEITLMLNTKPFDELLSCKEPGYNPILIVVVGTVHPHKKEVYGMPCYQ